MICPLCLGAGGWDDDHWTASGHDTRPVICPECDGTGEVVATPERIRDRRRATARRLMAESSMMDRTESARRVLPALGSLRKYLLASLRRVDRLEAIWTNRIVEIPRKDQ
jgi:uncharacterized Zn finger protein (UPF0148 family)